MSSEAPPEPAVEAPAANAPSMIARISAVLIPALICIAGVAFAGAMIATRPDAERTDPEAAGVPVRVQPLAASSESVAVRAQGQVIAARQIVLQPELSGRITWMNDELVPGGRLSEGDTLIRIDPRDYRAAVEQQRAQVENSRLSVSQEESRRVIAEREWELLDRERGGASERGRRLALREPHARAAEASLRASQSSLRQARTNLSRTSLRAPFDCLVLNENVDVGQLVAPTSQIATLVGTEHFWVRVAIPMDQLRWIRLPSNGEPGSGATVIARVGESDTISRQGTVVRLLGDLDPVGRMARVLVQVDDPLGAEGELPLLLGASVDVEIEAGTLDDVYRIPRGALHAGNRVHLFGGGELTIREVTVTWREEETLLVRGLAPGDELVLSRVIPAIAGTSLRRVEADDEADDDASPATAAVQ